MTNLSEEQREKLGHELAAIGKAAAGIRETMRPYFIALEGLGEANSLVLERYGVEEPVGECIACDRILFAGEDGHRCADGELFCAEHAPTFGDAKKALTAPEFELELNSGREPGLDTEDETGITLRERLAAIESHVAGGGSLDDKIIHPL